MKVLGIVSEYNPFHKGHEYQIEQAKEELSATHTVSVMSGNFVMRGEIAIFDKFTRAKAAVASGVDLVIELPTPYALASAEFFANGAIALLHGLNIVDAISFGSEAGALPALTKVAKELTKDQTQLKIKMLMKEGLPIFKAMEAAVGEKGMALRSPNNILGVHYLLALNKLNSPIVPHTLLRQGADYHSHDLQNNFASATGLREVLRQGGDIAPYVPQKALEIYEQATPVFEEALLQAIFYAIRVKTREELLCYPDVSEGLNHLIYEGANQCYSIEDLIFHVKSKRYSYTRIRRILYNILLDIRKGERSKPPEYARVLAFNEKGQELLAVLRKKSTLPVITNVRAKHLSTLPMLQTDFKAARIFQLACENKVPKGGFLSERL